MDINTYLQTAFSFAGKVEINNNWSLFEYNNQAFQCYKNAGEFWLIASTKKGKDTPACFEFDSELYDDEKELRLEEMFQEKEQLNHFLKSTTKFVQVLEQDNYFKLSIAFSEEAFFSNSFENHCQQIIETSLLEEVKSFRRKYESQY